MHVNRRSGAGYALAFRRSIRPAKHRWVAVCFASLTMASALPAAAARCYVNASANGGNTGASWVHAYVSVQSALVNPVCTEVWVARGVYKPVVPANIGSVTVGERAASFNIGVGVAVYGGFSGGETSRAARDPISHVTILSGDLDNNDDSNNVDGNFVNESSSEIVGSNSRHIVMMNGTAGIPITASTVLDGFTLTAGDNTNNNDGGGALWCRGSGVGRGCSPTLAKLRASGNRANSGGAMAFIGHSGGASSPALTDIAFSGNSANTFGGAMFNHAEASGTSSPTLTRVTFSDNRSTQFGGAMVSDGTAGGTSNPTLVNVTFVGNSANSGGAMFNNGGGGNSNPTLTNVTFTGNSASQGGAMYNFGGTNGHSNPNLNSVILWGNAATLSGPELFHFAGPGSTAQTFLFYGVIEGDCQGNMSCANTSASNPLLGVLTHNGGFTPTVMPGVGGSAINAVPCFLAPLTDQRGFVRPDPASAGLTNRCDMGAVEAGSFFTDLVFKNGFESP